MICHTSKAWNAIGAVPRRTTQQKSHQYVKRASTLGNVFVGENKATSEVKIRSFTRGSGSTIPGKINGTPAAIIIDTGAEVSIVRKGLVRIEGVETIPETIASPLSVTKEGNKYLHEEGQRLQRALRSGSIVKFVTDEVYLRCDYC